MYFPEADLNLEQHEKGILVSQYGKSYIAKAWKITPQLLELVQEFLDMGLVAALQKGHPGEGRLGPEGKGTIYLSFGPGYDQPWIVALNDQVAAKDGAHWGEISRVLLNNNFAPLLKKNHIESDHQWSNTKNILLPLETFRQNRILFGEYSPIEKERFSNNKEWRWRKECLERELFSNNDRSVEETTNEGCFFLARIFSQLENIDYSLLAHSGLVPSEIEPIFDRLMSLCNFDYNAWEEFDPEQDTRCPYFPPSEREKFPYYHFFKRVAAYGLFGIDLASERSSPDAPFVPGSIEHQYEIDIWWMIEQLRLLVEFVRLNEGLSRSMDEEEETPIPGSMAFAERVLAAAETRLLVDGFADGTVEPDGTVKPLGLSALTGVSLKSIKNQMSPSSGKILTTEGGEILIGEARRWLKSRSDFLETLELASNATDSESDLEEENETVQERFIFIPIASDGSIFHPKLEREGAYSIFTPEERQVDCYQEALELLSQQETPRWRRPTGKEKWTVVTAAKWERVPADAEGAPLQT